MKSYSGRSPLADTAVLARTVQPIRRNQPTPGCTLPLGPSRIKRSRRAKQPAARHHLLRRTLGSGDAPISVKSKTWRPAQAREPRCPYDPHLDRANVQYRTRQLA
jgi:hypothetical protein